MNLPQLTTQLVIQELELVIQKQWDEFQEEPVIVFKLSVPEKEVLFPLGCGDKPFSVLEASLRLTKRCDKSKVIQRILVHKGKRYGTGV